MALGGSGHYATDYDPDGSGSLGSQLIATFAGNPTLSASDITII